MTATVSHFKSTNCASWWSSTHCAALALAWATALLLLLLLLPLVLLAVSSASSLSPVSPVWFRWVPLTVGATVAKIVGAIVGKGVVGPPVGP